MGQAELAASQALRTVGTQDAVGVGVACLMKLRQSKCCRRQCQLTCRRTACIQLLCMRLAVLQPMQAPQAAAAAHPTCLPIICGGLACPLLIGALAARRLSSRLGTVITRLSESFTAILVSAAPSIAVRGRTRQKTRIAPFSSSTRWCSSLRRARSASQALCSRKCVVPS